MVSSSIFKVFGMTRPGIEPRSPGPLANTLNAGPMSRFLVITTCPHSKRKKFEECGSCPASLSYKTFWNVVIYIKLRLVWHKAKSIGYSVGIKLMNNGLTNDSGPQSACCCVQYWSNDNNSPQSNLVYLTKPYLIEHSHTQYFIYLRVKSGWPQSRVTRRLTF